MAFPSEKTLGRVYGAIKSKLVFKPGDGGGGGGGGGGGSPRGPDDPFRDEDEEIELDDDDIVEVDDDEGAAGEAKSRGDIRNAARPFFEKNQPPGTGTSDANRDLAEIHCQELESYISRYLRTFGQKASLRPVVKKIMKSIVPGYVMDPIQKEAAKQVEETGGHGVIGLPVGTRSSRVKNRPLNGVVLAIVDESQSMTDPAVAAAKTALMNTCAQQKLAVISVGMAESTNDLGFATFIKGQTNPKDFMKRFKEGGTGAFHQILFDFPEIMKDTKIQKALTDALPKHISVDDLLQLHKEGKMCGIIVTDGDIQTEHLSGSRLDAYRNYAERYKATVGKGEPPLYLLSIKKSHVPPVAPNNPKLYDGVNLNMPELLR
jgi:hypothetical protein